MKNVIWIDRSMDLQNATYRWTLTYQAWPRSTQSVMQVLTHENYAPITICTRSVDRTTRACKIILAAY